MVARPLSLTPLSPAASFAIATACAMSSTTKVYVVPSFSIRSCAVWVAVLWPGLVHDTWSLSQEEERRATHEAARTIAARYGSSA